MAAHPHQVQIELLENSKWPGMAKTFVSSLPQEHPVVFNAIFPANDRADGEAQYQTVIKLFQDIGGPMGWKFREALRENDPIAAQVIKDYNQSVQYLLEDGGANRRAWEDRMRGKYSGHIVGERV